MMNVAQGHLFGTIFEAILYGIYFTLFIICLFIFNDGKGANKIILTTTCVMFLLSTAHLAGTIRTMQDGFFGKMPPILYFNDKPLPLNLANKSLYGLNMLVGDALLIYRVWIIYQKSFLVILLPILTLAGTCVSVVLLAWEFSQLKPGQSAFVHSVTITAPAAFALPLATNVMITALIVFRVKQAERSMKLATPEESTPIYRKIIAGTIESCILYPIALAITLILYCTKNNGQDILTGSMTQLIALVPTLMWMQVRFGGSRYEAAAATSTRNGTGVTTALAFAPAASLFHIKSEDAGIGKELSARHSTDDSDVELAR